MQKINNLSRWVVLDEGQRVDFPNPKPRVVRLDVNAPSAACLYIFTDPNGEESADPLFLARVEGRDLVEFHSEGAFGLTVEGGSVNLYTVDGDDPSFRLVEPQAFVKVIERRRRNPEVEFIMHKMQQNLDRRMEQQAHEFRGLLESRERAKAALAETRRVPKGDRKTPKSTDNPKSSDSQTAPAGGGGQSDVTK